MFIDIDGTLADSKGQISEENIAAIKEIEKEDFEIVFCSGRYNGFLMEILKKRHCGRYAISSNGSLIYDYDKETILYSKQIPFDLLKNLYEYCNKMGLSIIFNGLQKRYGNKIDRYENKRNHFTDVHRLEDISDIRNELITQVVIGSPSYDQMLEVGRYLRKRSDVEIVNLSTTLKEKNKASKSGYFYDVALKGTNKGEAIKRFIELMHTSKDNCIAIGDHVNDLGMFEEVGYCIAMDNALQDLKDKADFVTKSNDENGVAHAIKHLQKVFRK